jgi:hypothetical protein
VQLFALLDEGIVRTPKERGDLQIILSVEVIWSSVVGRFGV